MSTDKETQITKKTPKIEIEQTYSTFFFVINNEANRNEEKKEKQSGNAIKGNAQSKNCEIWSGLNASIFISM